METEIKTVKLSDRTIIITNERFIEISNSKQRREVKLSEIRKCTIQREKAIFGFRYFWGEFEIKFSTDSFKFAIGDGERWADAAEEILSTLRKADGQGNYGIRFVDHLDEN